jgi:RNA polymerase sigma-70 factor (sigma-E family)
VTFEEFVDYRLGALLRYATVVTCDSHLAEDITQEVLVRAQGRWHRIVQLDAPERYVKRMILNEFLSWRRRRAARVVPLPKERLDSVAQAAPDHAVARDERDAMLRLIAALPPKQRAAIALRFYEDLSDDEIADLLGCRSVTVRSHISRALVALRRALPGPLAATIGEQPWQ